MVMANSACSIRDFEGAPYLPSSVLDLHKIQLPIPPQQFTTRILPKPESRNRALSQAFTRPVQKTARTLTHLPAANCTENCHAGEKVLSLLFDLHKESKSTLVLVTHDERVTERCQHRVRMEGGRLYEI